MKSTFERNVSEGQDLPFWVAAVVAVILMLVVAGCKRQGPQAGQMPPPPTVTVAKVERRPIVDWEEFTGRTAPIDFVEVRPRTSGYISEVRFKAGQMVKKGDVLFVIDNSDSMLVKQESLKKNIDRFVEAFEKNARLDFLSTMYAFAVKKPKA